MEPKSPSPAGSRKRANSRSVGDGGPTTWYDIRSRVIGTSLTESDPKSADAFSNSFAAHSSHTGRIGKPTDGIHEQQRFGTRQGFQISITLPWLACYVGLGAVLYADHNDSYSWFDEDPWFRMALASVLAYGASDLLMDICAGACTYACHPMMSDVMSEDVWEAAFHLYNVLRLPPLRYTVWSLASWMALPYIVVLPVHYTPTLMVASCTKAEQSCAVLHTAVLLNRVFVAVGAVSSLRLIVLLMVRHYSSTHLQNKYQVQVLDATFKRRAMRRLVEHTSGSESSSELAMTPLLNESRDVTNLTKRNFWYHVALLENHSFPLTEDYKPNSEYRGTGMLSEHVQQRAADLFALLGETFHRQTFQQCMPIDDAAEAWQICSGFDTDRESSLTQEEFSKVCAALAVEHANLCIALFESSYTTDFLRTLSGAVTGSATFAGVLWVSGVDLFNEILVLGSSLLISGAFAFKRPIERWVDALLLILVKQPFDIGDYVVIKDSKGYEGYGLTVLQITIEYTTFRDKISNVVYISNADLYNSTITNWSRSPCRKIFIIHAIALETTASQLGALEDFVRLYISERSHTYLPSIEIFLHTPWMSPATTHLKWELRVTHRLRGPSISRGAGYRADRSALNYAVNEAMRRFGIQPETSVLKYVKHYPHPEHGKRPSEEAANQCAAPHFAPSVYHDPTKCFDDDEPLSASSALSSLNFGMFDTQLEDLTSGTGRHLEADRRVRLHKSVPELRLPPTDPKNAATGKRK